MKTAKDRLEKDLKELERDHRQLLAAAKKLEEENAGIDKFQEELKKALLEANQTDRAILTESLRIQYMIKAKEEEIAHKEREIDKIENINAQ